MYKKCIVNFLLGNFFFLCFIDLCNFLDCFNNGLCIVNFNGMVECYCVFGFKGVICDIGIVWYN